MPNKLLAGLPPVHPGDVLGEDVLPALGRPKSEIARLLGISRTTLYGILNGENGVTSDMALRIAKLTGTNPKVWLNLQQDYDLCMSERKLARELARIPTLEAA
ncbi:MAG: HigA family addiction module antitoxin [Sphingosinicella sp.]